MQDANDKVIVITGASAGIGAALARELARSGHRIVLAARRGEELARMVAECEGAGGQALAVPTDVTVRAEVERLRDRALERFGAVDVWVNNVGRGIYRPVLELTDVELDDMMAVNVKSALYGMQAIVPYFLQRGRGHLLNVSSFLGRVPLATYRSAYNAAKAALNALTANLRVDLLRAGASGVHVTLVMPGVVTTDFARNAVGAPPDARPTGGGAPVQTPDEVAASIAAVIAEPRAELYTNPAQVPLVARYIADVGAFERELLARGG